MRTEDFVERLALDVTPVRPLRRPWIRAAVWSLGTSLYLGVLALLMTSSDDLAVNATRPSFIVQQVFAIATSVTAAAAALGSIVPGYSRRVLLVPAVAATAWMASILVEFPQASSEPGLAGLVLPREWPCVVTIVLGGALPALGLAFMLRSGAPLTPRLTTGLSVLAAAMLASVVTCVAAPHPSGIAVLLWHGGTVLALISLTAAAGRSILPWRPARPG